MKGSYIIICYFFIIVFYLNCKFKLEYNMKRKSSQLHNLEEPPFKKQKISSSCNNNKQTNKKHIVECNINFESIQKKEISNLKNKLSKCPSYYKKNKLLISGCIKKVESEINKLVPYEIRLLIEKFHFDIDILIELISTTYYRTQLETPLNFIKQLQSLNVIENCFMINEFVESYTIQNYKNYEIEIGKINYPKIELIIYDAPKIIKDITIIPDHFLDRKTQFYFILSKDIYKEFIKEISIFLNIKGINDKRFVKLNKKEQISLFYKLQMCKNLSLIEICTKIQKIPNLFYCYSNICFINSISHKKVRIGNNHRYSHINMKDILKINVNFTSSFY